MPNVKANESKTDYMARCIPQVLKEGLDQKAAVGKCEGMYNSVQKTTAIKEILFKKDIKKAVNITISYVTKKLAVLEKEQVIKTYSDELPELMKAMEAGGIQSKSLATLIEKNKTKMVEIYAACRKDGNDKPYALKTALNQVYKMGK